MKKLQLYVVFIFLIASSHAGAQETGWTIIPLNNFDAFNAPGKNWTIGSNAVADYTKAGDMKALAGQGAAVNVIGEKDNSPLTTKQEFGDVELELDFMMAKSSNSGVYLQGRYEVQLFDSWTKLKPTFADCGGIYQRWNDTLTTDDKGYEGTAPIMNVAKAPGLWQHLVIKFRAPKFDAAGNKTANARFEEVYLNGVLIQQQATVTGPTRSSLFNDEKPTGPVMIQGDHGNVAFKNIRYHLPVNAAKINQDGFDNPITINPDNRPYILRGFLNYGDKKLTHSLSVGSQSQMHFSYDLKEGALLQVWRGQFLDVTEMWHERGEPQLQKPLGSVIRFSDAPALAILTDANAAWPDSVAFDDFHNKGYSLDSSHFPTFKYTYNGINVSDKIYPQSNRQSLIRELWVAQPPSNLYCRIAIAESIESLSAGLFNINNGEYYLIVNENLKPVIRTTAKGKELVVLYPPSATSLTYSITW